MPVVAPVVVHLSASDAAVVRRRLDAVAHAAKGSETFRGQAAAMLTLIVAAIATREGIDPEAEWDVEEGSDGRLSIAYRVVED